MVMNAINNVSDYACNNNVVVVQYSFFYTLKFLTIRQKRNFWEGGL